jgi:hypothetical protein
MSPVIFRAVSYALRLGHMHNRRTAVQGRHIGIVYVHYDTDRSASEGGSDRAGKPRRAVRGVAEHNVARPRTLD